MMHCVGVALICIKVDVNVYTSFGCGYVTGIRGVGLGAKFVCCVGAGMDMKVQMLCGCRFWQLDVGWAWVLM